MTKKKILFLIPDGVGIRNYLYSDILSHLKQEAEIVFWSPLPENAFDEVKKLYSVAIEYKNIKLNVESILTRLFRESATYGRLISNSHKTNNATVLTNWNYNPKSIKLKLLNNLSMALGNWSSKKYSRTLRLEQRSKNHWKRSIVESYKKDLVDLKPSCIFITHQRVAGLMPICLAAKALGIPVITAIYSWDNLPKARLAVTADTYLVWSDYMKEEMKMYYPEINQEDVLVTGTPQFEFYHKEKLLVSRADFATLYGLDSSKKWICFSGDDVTTSPNDSLYLKDVAKSLADANALNDVQIIFRRSPVDFSDRYDVVLNEFNSIVSIDPQWHKTVSGWATFFPKFSDVSLLVNLAFHCDLVINVGSTMAHDFAIFNTPCFYINYNKNVNVHWSTETIYKFQHFRTMQHLDAVGWLNSSEDIADKIVEALEHPDSVGKDRKKWLEKIVQHPLGEASKKIAHVLLNPN